MLFSARTHRKLAEFEKQLQLLSEVCRDHLRLGWATALFLGVETSPMRVRLSGLGVRISVSQSSNMDGIRKRTASWTGFQISLTVGARVERFS